MSSGQGMEELLEGETFSILELGDESLGREGEYSRGIVAVE